MIGTMSLTHGGLVNEELDLLCSFLLFAVSILLNTDLY